MADPLGCQTFFLIDEIGSWLECADLESSTQEVGRGPLCGNLIARGGALVLDEPFLYLDEMVDSCNYISEGDCHICSGVTREETLACLLLIPGLLSYLHSTSLSLLLS